MPSRCLTSASCSLRDDIHAKFDAFVADEHVGPAMSLRTSCWLLRRTSNRAYSSSRCCRPCSCFSPDQLSPLGESNQPQTLQRDLTKVEAHRRHSRQSGGDAEYFRRATNSMYRRQSRLQLAQRRHRQARMAPKKQAVASSLAFRILGTRASRSRYASGMRCKQRPKVVTEASVTSEPQG